ncbi:MAG: hypothetical protein KJ043_23400, partial [Anaerolineae bacterium]|nr:hypothetical protein [Anaerolineae bacterium]
GNVRIIDNGDSDIDNEGGIHLLNLIGTSTWNAIEVAESFEDNIRVLNDGTNNLTQLTMTNSIIRDNSVVSPGNNGILVEANGNNSVTVDITNTQFLRNRANGVQVNTNNGGSADVEVRNSVFTNNNIGVNLAHNGSGTFFFDVVDNDLIASVVTNLASPININLGFFGNVMDGNVIDNTIDNNNSPTGPGMRVIGNGSGTMTILIQNNTITEIGNRGIEVIARDGNNRINATIFDNTITLTDPLSADAIRVDAGATSTDTTTICADFNGDNLAGNRNNATTIAGLNGIRIRQRFAGTTYILEDYAGGATNMAAVQAFLDARNTLSPTSLADFAGGGFIGIADCPMPTP